MAPAVNGSALTTDIASRIEMLAAEAGFGGLQRAAALLNSVALLLHELAEPSTPEEFERLSFDSAEPSNILPC